MAVVFEVVEADPLTHTCVASGATGFLHPVEPQEEIVGAPDEVQEVPRDDVAQAYPEPEHIPSLAVDAYAVQLVLDHPFTQEEHPYAAHWLFGSAELLTYPHVPAPALE